MSAELITKAKALLSQRASTEAKRLLTELVKTPSPHVAEAHGLLGAIAFQARDFLAAADHFQSVTKDHPDAHRLYFDEAYAAELGGDTDRALKAYKMACVKAPAQGRYYLYFGCALHASGEVEAAIMVWSAGADIDPMVRQAQFHPRADDDLKSRSALADKALREWFSTLHRTTIPETVPRVREAIWPQTHDVPFQYKHRGQQPWMFYMPDLPATAVPTRQTLDWAVALEAATASIRQEYLAAATPDMGTPYIHDATMQDPAWDTLRGSGNWQAIHLYKDGIEKAESALFPNTLKALESVPTVKLNDNPLEVFFSVLAPKTHIPRHFGLANSRLTVHLPLIIPDNCSIRVGDEVYEWAEGEVFAFDDSFDHEAWNKSDHPRVVLIFEAWAPDLSEQECEAIEQGFAARDNWLKARHLPEV